MITEVYSFIASIVENELVDLDDQKIKDLIQESERISKINRSLNKKLENHGLGSEEFNELKDKILSLEKNLKDSNERLGILK